MRRRRQKNTLLPKMIGIAVVVNAILLPILAKIGVFKGSHERITEVKLVKLPPLEKKPPEPKKVQAKKRAAKAHPAHPLGRKPATRLASHPSLPNPNQPKVVASAGTGTGRGPAIDNSGTGTAGQLPTTPTAPSPTVEQAPPPPTPPVEPTLPPPAPVAPSPPTPIPTPAPKPIADVPYAILAQPKPHIPSDFGVEQDPQPLEALFTIHPDGTSSVKMLSSTGNTQLDMLALEAARRWSFRPAQHGGAPVESFLKLKVEFDVS